jgi:hydrogenase/urease accessory protein HupE
MTRLQLIAALLAMVAMGAPVHAHEVRPGYLELRQTGAETFDVLWKVPARGDMKLGIYVQLPESCAPLSGVASTKGGGAFMDRWAVTCPGGLSGETISIDGLSGTLTDALARIERLDGTSLVARLTPDAPSFVVEAAPRWQQIAGTYLSLGVEHILLGIDHLLFVFALLLLVKGWRRLVATVTAFTVAHSLTLAAATLGYVHVPQRPVEAVIALSIVFVAAELVRLGSGRTSVTHRWPWAIAFTFGLLHGFGFAGALSEIGLPEQAIPLALLFFNVGVEVGQLLFIAVVVSVGAVARHMATPLPTWAPRLSAYAIGAVAAFWTIERVAGF